MAEPKYTPPPEHLIEAYQFLVGELLENPMAPHLHEAHWIAVKDFIDNSDDTMRDKLWKLWARPHDG